MDTPETRIRSDHENGVLYIVMRNRKILDEASYSAYTLKKHNPALATQLITDITGAKGESGFDYIDTVQQGMNPWKAKVKYLAQTRFSKTLYLDADTEIRGEIGELFDLLHQHDIGLTFDNHCDWQSAPVRFIAQESEDINTGFFLYKRSTAMDALLKEWLERIMQQEESVMTPGTLCDQHYFNTFFRDNVIHGTTYSAQVLSNEVYNVRPWCWSHLKDAGKFQNVKILHAHHLNHGLLQKLKRRILQLIQRNK